MTKIIYCLLTHILNYQTNYLIKVIIVLILIKILVYLSIIYDFIYLLFDVYPYIKKKYIEKYFRQKNIVKI